LPADTRMITDDRKLPTGTVAVAGTDYDFRAPRLIGHTQWDHAVTGLTPGADGNTWVSLKDPSTGVGVSLWADAAHRWLQIYTADDAPAINRRSLAVEPMTGPPDAFRSSQDVIRLSPAGAPGDSVTTTWGIVALAN
jgi:aldose 1-epimerase